MSRARMSGLAGLALFALVFASGQGILTGSRTVEPASGSASAPSDTTVVWINTARDYKPFVFDSSRQLWKHGPFRWQFDRSTLAVAEALRFGANGSACDTTTTSASEDGYFSPDSIVITSLLLASSGTSAPACSVEVFEVAGGTVSAIIDTGWAAKDTVLAGGSILAGPGIFAAYIATGSTQPDRPHVEVEWYEFERPAAP